jgi:hypothetical protein
MEYARHPAGMKIVKCKDASGRVSAFPVDEFLRCYWSDDVQAYRVVSKSGNTVLVDEATAIQLCSDINKQIALTSQNQ